jgi:hypothetical protein
VHSDLPKSNSQLRRLPTWLAEEGKEVSRSFFGIGRGAAAAALSLGLWRKPVGPEWRHFADDRWKMEPALAPAAGGGDQAGTKAEARRNQSDC